MLDTNHKKQVIRRFGKNDQDTGSISVQIGLHTDRIQKIAAHLQHAKKDKHSRRGLIGIICARKKLLKYLKRKNLEDYNTVITALKIRG